MDPRTAATELVQIMRQAGYLAYFAGGWVRDLLLGHPSGDIDIATEAPPEKIMELFPHTVPIGVSFGVVLVVHHHLPFEVTSFRKDGLYLYGRRPETITFATPQEDAARRDFTINGMFFDPLHNAIIDYVGGREDLQQGIIRAIGRAEERIQEDRLRMVRAVRVMARFGFALEPATRQAIERYASSLFPAVAVERIWQEFHKMAKHRGFGSGLVELHRLGLLQEIFPSLKGVSETTLLKQTAPMERFPFNTPAILYLIQLFQAATETEIKRTAAHLKLARKELELALYYRASARFFKTKETDRVRWAYLLSAPESALCCAVYAETLPEPERTAFQRDLESFMQELETPIQRLREGKPLLRATHLQEEGIAPGKIMGKLLKESERLAITHGLRTPAEVLALLKQSPVWQEEKS